MSPLWYLVDWRMHLAMRFLQDDNQKLSHIAANLGYESDTAFSKAFKKKTGTTPSEYRYRERQDAAFSRQSSLQFARGRPPDNR
jgi:AraC-like DNA-binding protein